MANRLKDSAVRREINRNVRNHVVTGRRQFSEEEYKGRIAGAEEQPMQDICGSHCY
jgi:hypothetical protein